MSQAITFSNEYPDVYLILGQRSINHRSLYDYKEKIQHLLTQDLNEPFPEQFIGLSLDEINQYFDDLLNKIDILSSLNLISAVEAKLRRDYLIRLEDDNPDELSMAFSDIDQTQRKNVRLADDILKAWKRKFPQHVNSISSFNAALNYRDWIAHGRYWIPSLGRRYDFAIIFTICEQIVSNLPLRG